MDPARKTSSLLPPPPVTISNLDDSESSSSSETMEMQKLLRRIPSEMFLVSLLEELCACYAKDNGQQKILFKMLSGYLSKAKMIPVTTTRDEFQQVRATYRMAIKKFLSTALTASQADPQERFLSLPSPAVGDQIRKAFLINSSPMQHQLLLNNNFSPHMSPVISRYKKDFVELGRIGKGGFGSVYRVRSILDNQEYAIKKIKLKGTDKEFYEKVIREVKLLAGMQHQNIVRYNTAWIDHQPPSHTSPKNSLPAIEYPMNLVLNRQESSSSDDFESEMISRAVETTCIIKDVTDELSEEDCEFNCDPNIDEYIDESDVEISFSDSTINDCNDNISYTHTTYSRRSLTVSKSENIQCTSEEEEFHVDFEGDYVGDNSRSHHEHSTTITSSSIETKNISPSNGIHLSGDFGEFLSANDNFCGHKKSVRFEESSNHIDNGLVNFDNGTKPDKHHSFSSTACMGARKEQENISHGHKDASEFEKSRVILYIQMELCSRTLCCWLDERNEREPMQGCDVFSIVDDSANQSILKQMIEGISYIHHKNLLHRDLTPKNIFLAGAENDLHVCIGDFGLAREHRPVTIQDPVTPIATLHNQLSEVVIPASILTTDIGTGTYASPEQLNGHTYDHKSDMYSLGVICFELYHPFKSQMEKSKCLKALREDRAIPDEIKLKWPDEFTLIEQLTSPDPGVRPSADELKKGKLFLSKDELIKCLKEEVKEKNDVIEKLRLELQMMRGLQRS